MPGRAVRLTGWGRISPSSAELAEPATASGAAGLLARGAAATVSSGVICRGPDRSYTNAAQRGGGLVISTARLTGSSTWTARAPSLVTVLKRFGTGNDGLLSFPASGWTLALRAELDPAGILASDLSRRRAGDRRR